MQTDNPTLASAYVLHYRAYRDTSLLIELFTEHHGRISAVAKGARSQRSPWRGLLLPGVPLLVTCVGKNELLTLSQAEPNGSPLILQGKALFSLFYVNELLMYLLHRFDPHAQLYEQYAQTLSQLATTTQLDVPLRLFEWKLLQELGYGLALDKDIRNQQPIRAEACYQIDLDRGATEYPHTVDDTSVYQGKTLLAFSSPHLFDTPDILREAKRLTRQLLQPLLGDKEIISRSLFS